MGFYTPFENFEPRIVDASTTAIEAEQRLSMSGEQLMFVVDSDNYILGVVRLEKLKEYEVSKRASDLCTREQISVIDFIEPKFRIKAFNHNELASVSVDDVKKALNESGYRHCFVIDREKNVVQGVISLADIVKWLNSNE